MAVQNVCFWKLSLSMFNKEGVESRPDLSRRGPGGAMLHAISGLVLLCVSVFLGVQVSFAGESPIAVLAEDSEGAASTSQLTATPVMTVTPTATVNTTMVSGQTLPGAFVSCADLGSVVADSSGYFSFAGTEAGRTYTLVFRLSGYSFDPDSVQVEAGGTVKVLDVNQIIMSGCQVKSFQSVVFAADLQAMKLRDFIQGKIAYLEKMIPSEALQKRKAFFARVQKAKAQNAAAFKNFMLKAVSIPVDDVKCSQIAQCQDLSLKQIRKSCQKDLRKMSNVFKQLMNALNGKMKAIKAFKIRETLSQLDKLRAAALRKLSWLPDSVQQCGSRWVDAPCRI